jgi:hypothetical protein
VRIIFGRLYVADIFYNFAQYFRLLDMLRYSVATQKKLEAICTELGYVVRYEKGHFQSGYCLLEARKVLVINKFYGLEGKINSLLELLVQLDAVGSGLLDTERAEWLQRQLNGRVA